MLTDIEIKTATSEDAEEIKALLYETAVWISKKGSSQWAGLLKGEDVHGVSSAIDRGEVYLVYLKEEFIGTLALWDKQTAWDRDLWEEDTSSDYYYLHRIAVEKSQHGKGMGKYLLKAAKILGKDNNKLGIRLDCIADKPYLNKFYSSNGFTFVKTIKDYDNGEGLQNYNLYDFILKK